MVISVFITSVLGKSSPRVNYDMTNFHITYTKSLVTDFYTEVFDDDDDGDLLKGI